jgi:uncharacterized protein
VKLLVETIARVNVKDDNGETALMKACSHGHNAVIQFLIAFVSGGGKRKSVSGSSLNAAAAASDLRRMLDSKDDEGVTPMMKAAEAGQIDVMKLLITLGASLQARDDEGQT